MKTQLTSADDWSTFDHLPEGVIIVEADGTIYHINPAAMAFWGLGEGGNVPSHVNQLFNDEAVWQTLQTPVGKEQHCSANGRFLECHAQPYFAHDKTFVQITVQVASTRQTGNKTINDPLAPLTRVSDESDFAARLQSIVNGLHDAGWQQVVLVLWADVEQTSRRFSAGTPIPTDTLTPVVWQSWLADPASPIVRQGNCYLVHNKSLWHDENLVHPTSPTPEVAESQWQPHDLLITPLLSQQQTLGLLLLGEPVNGRRPDALTCQTIEVYAQFAVVLAENGRLHLEAINRRQEFEILYQANQDLSGMLEEEPIISLIAEHARKSLHADGFTTYRWQSQDDTLTLLADVPNQPGAATLPLGHCLTVQQNDAISKALINQHPIAYQQGDDSFDPILNTSWLDPERPVTGVYLPLVVSDETTALIHLIRQNDPRRPTERELRLLSALATQGGNALETAYIFQDTYEREQFYNALGSVSLAINFTLEHEALLNLICDETLHIFDVDGVYIWQIVDNQFIGSAARGFSEEGFVGATLSATDTEAFVTTIARNGQAMYINNVIQSRSIALRLPQKETAQAVLGVPLEQEGNIIGVLILIDTQNPNRFSHKHLTRASIFGVQIAIALQNAQLFEELRRFNLELDLRVAERTRALNEESNRVKILLRITSELSASLDQDHVLNQALHLVNEVVNATQGVILLIDTDKDEFVFRAAVGLERPIPPRGVPTGMLQHEGLAGWMIENRSAVIVDDTRHDPRWVARPDSSEHRAVLGVPLISNEEVIGVMMLFHSEPGAFTLQQLDLVEAAAIQVANAINNANLYLLIRDQAERLGRLLHAEQIETAKSQAILESIADGVLVADSHSKIILGNRPVSAILDIPRQRLIGKSVNELLGLYGHSGDSWIQTIEKWAQHADAVEELVFLADELTIEDKVVSVHLSPVMAGKQFFGTVSIFRDITKEVEVDKLKSEFVSTVSHELRTPMTSIKGYADLMLMGAAGKMTPPQERYLKVIKNNADRLHMLVNDLLNISRIETGKTTLDLRPLDVPQVIEQVVEGHLRGRIQHEQKQLAVSTDIEPSLPLVNADHQRVTQILTNLIDNAFNYTPIQGEIRLKVRKNGDYVYISVQDSGIGISKENQTKIFDRFFRAEDELVQSVPGTGLGLAIVRSLIEMHGGELQVESKLGQGSTFTFNLPVVVETSDPT